MSCVNARPEWRWRLVGTLKAPKERSVGSPASWVYIQRRCVRGARQLRSIGRASWEYERGRPADQRARGNRELRRADEILRKASAYFAQAESGRR